MLTQIHRRYCLLTGLLLFVAVLLTGCGSSSGGMGGPKLTGGFVVGNTHNLTVGETVNLRLPLRADGSRAWRVSKWDSGFLSIVDRARVVQGGSGQELSVTVRARTPGRTSIEVTEVAPMGQAPRMHRFELSIQPQ